MKTMINQTATESLEMIFQGFRQISQTEQSEYLKYLDLVIERKRDAKERRRLVQFKTKLEKEIINAEIYAR